MTWIVLKFLETNEVDVVPTSWYDRERQMCVYPPYSKGHLQKAIKQEMPVPCDPEEEGWINYSAITMSTKEYDNFATASAKAAKACFTSDISEAEMENLPEKRTRKKKLLSSSESDDGRDTPDEPSLMNVPKMRHSNVPKTVGLPRDHHRSGISQSSNSESSISHSSESNLVKSKSVQALSDFCLIPPTELPLGDDLQKVIIKYLVINKNLLEGLEKKITQLTISVNNMEKTINSIKVSDQSAVVVLEEGNAIFSSIPVNTEEELQKFKETIAADTKIFQALIKKLAHIGGSSYKECVRRYLAKLMSDHVAKGYTLHGHRNGKNSFIESPFFKVVIDAVQETFSDASHKNIELQIGIWLTKATERIKERQRKEKNKDGAPNDGGN